MKNKNLSIILLFLFFLVISFTAIWYSLNKNQNKNFCKYDIEYNQQKPINNYEPNINPNKQNLEWRERSLVFTKNRYKSKEKVDNIDYDLSNINGPKSGPLLKETYATYISIELPDTHPIVWDYYLNENLKSFNPDLEPYPCNIYKIYNATKDSYLQIKNVCTSWGGAGDLFSSFSEIGEYSEIKSPYTSEITWTGDKEKIIRTNNTKYLKQDEIAKYYTVTVNENNELQGIFNIMTYWNDPEGPFGLSAEISIISKSGKQINNEDLEFFDRIVGSIRYNKSRLVNVHFIQSAN